MERPEPLAARRLAAELRGWMSAYVANQDDERRAHDRAVVGLAVLWWGRSKEWAQAAVARVAAAYRAWGVDAAVEILRGDVPL